MAEMPPVLQQALARYRSGDILQAERLFRAYLQDNPGDARTLHALGVLCIRKGDSAAAIEYLTSAVACPGAMGSSFAALATALQNAGRNDQAVRACHEAIRFDPSDYRAYNTLGNALRGEGRIGEAEASFRHALSLSPQSADIWCNLGSLFAEAGRRGEAVAAYREALGIDSRMLKACLNCGDLLLQGGNVKEALDLYRQALEIDPGCADIYFKLGNLFHARRSSAKAVEFYDYALALDPDYAAAYRNKGVVLYETGRYADAERALAAAFHRRPSDGLRVKLATLVPPIVSSPEDIARIWERVFTAVDALRVRDLEIRDPLREIGNPNFFYIAYYGGNDREMNSRIADLFRFLPASVAARHGEVTSIKKVRVGFISRFFFGHSVGAFFFRMIELLAEDERLEVIAFCIGEAADRPGSTKGGMLKRVPLAVDLASARRTIADHGLDVLVYTDIGMDPLTYYLAFTRLAPVQCVTIGHLVTTGIPAIDYFLSSRLIEPDDAGDHYSETLVKLEEMPCYIEPPSTVRQGKDKARLGLPDGVHFYLCPMRLNKVHPDFDQAIGAILRCDRNGEVVFFRDREENDWHELLAARFAEAMPDVIGRVRFLPWAEPEDFRDIIACSDVVLDTFHFGGGVTASIILWEDTPIVTWPGPRMRGRLTAGFYRKMGISDCIAGDQEEYVRIAVRLGTDEAFRETVRLKIRARKAALYGDTAIVRELAAFFRSVAGSGPDT